MNTSFGPEALQAILVALPDPGFILTESGGYAAIYGGTDSRYYHDGSGLVGQRMHDVLHPAKADWFLQQIHAALAQRKMQVVEYELSNRDVLGLPDEGPVEPIWFEGRISPLDFRIEGEAAVLWVASNITARKRLEDQLRAQSETDELTGLYNRRKLMAEIAAHHQAYVRYGQPTSVIYFDIDHFKTLNDAHGHHAGDAALQAVAQAVRSQLRKTDLAARLGGDEFVVACPHTGPEDAQTFAQRLCASVTTALAPYTASTRVGGISAGVATTESGDSGPDDLLRRADAGLYEAKRKGRDRVVYVSA
jgi:two-component system cell cycle response regulator